MHHLFILLSSCFLLQDAIVTQLVVPMPEGYTLIQSVQGDLDKDSIPELVVAYNTEALKEKSFKNVPRELIIYKQKEGSWAPWKSSMQALYGSRGGGMQGDPFDTMEIKQGILHISQQGGSSWKWRFTDKYRFQEEEFYLIGYTSTSGAPCEYWEDVDFNVSTGRMIVKKEWEDCDSDAEGRKISETASVKGLKVTLQDRHAKRIHVVTPVEGLEVFVSSGSY